MWRETLGLTAISFVMCAVFAASAAIAEDSYSWLGLPYYTSIPLLITSFLVVLGYFSAIVLEARTVVGLYVSIVVLLVVNYYIAFGFVVVGLSVVAFAPQRGEKNVVRKKARRGAHTKASVAADQGRLPRWACLVYLCLTLTFIALAFSEELGADKSGTNCFPCECSSNHELINCYGDATTLEWTTSSWNRIKFLPDVLKLPNSGIKGIKPGSFESMDWLERLDLSRNKIRGIEAATFQGLGQLRELNLDAGLAMRYEVVAGTFLGLRNLEELRMSRNDISILRASAFVDLGRLQVLDLSSNRLENIEPGAFVGLGSLESLKLQKENTIQYAEGTTSKLQSDHSALTVLKNGTFAGLDALSGTLDLSLYGIQSIEPGAFLGLRNLKILLLQSNDLHGLQANTFIGLENLNELHLGGNYLSMETIEPGAFAGLDNLEGILFLDEMCDSLRATDELPPSATCW